MSKNKLSVLLIILIAGVVYSQGTIISDSFYSSSLDEIRNYEIYLPEGYTENEYYYPTVYFLHGISGYSTYTNSIQNILDELIDTESILEMIVVLPDGGNVLYEGSFYTNSELNGPFEEYIVYDLVNQIDETYRTIQSNNYRAISGHSMGGYGTMFLAMKHPDIFSSLSAHSGPIKLENLDNSTLILFLQLENFFGEFSPNAGPISLMLFALSAAFSPNLDNPPYYVDLPLTPSGDIINEVFDTWMEYDPYTMIGDYLESLETLNIYFDCGTSDELQLYSHSQEFSDNLNDLGIEHIFESYEGSHSSNIPQRLEVSFLVHSNHFEAIDPGIPGDVNGDGEVNILDVVLVVNIILDELEPTPDEYWAADINGDDIVDVLDIVGLINIILDN